MDYNTSRTDLKQPEYGRTIQKMVDYCLTIEDRNERTLIAKTIINVMASTISNYKGTPEMRQKLWHHLEIMADYKLDVDCEFDLKKEETIKHVNSKIEYKSEKIIYRHYGKFAQQMVRKINTIENKEEREKLIEAIGNTMKRVCKVQKNEIVADNVIFENMQEMSGTAIEIPENLKLTDLKDNQNSSRTNNNQTNNNQNQKKKNKKKKTQTIR